ncbi:unnamed protein product [Polarella glacialis]|uniref:Rad21/Rec8-like protein C-terminal eukaryotic domain-containing protein n=2 Tax=Polarella glacialis TaxID=89957 RepID=A0A813LX53_POLGL|nr:unnamed protein product [Polarella glacialis]
MVPLEEMTAAEEQGAEAGYDVQTAQVGVVIRRFVERGGVEAGERGVTLDDLIPPRTTERATAARTFGALLALATGGDLRVQQAAPYGLITIRLP